MSKGRETTKALIGQQIVRLGSALTPGNEYSLLQRKVTSLISYPTEEGKWSAGN